LLTNAAAFDRAHARASGVADGQLQQARLFRLTQGWYHYGDCAPGLDEACAVLHATLPPDAVFSDLTAALLYGLPVPSFAIGPEAPVHVTLTPRQVVPRRKELAIHQRTLRTDQTRLLRGLPVTTPDRLYADLAITMSREELAVVGDALLNRALATAESIGAELATLRRRRGLVVAREVLPLLDGRAQSPPETIVRLRLADAGLPAEPQVPVVDATGQIIGHTDLGYREERVGLEYEGRHHAEGAQFDYDIDRYSRFAAAGWLVIRCGRRDLADGSAQLIQRVRAALASR
jgi:hypothetical protein